METLVECKSVDTPGQVTVMSEMEIGELRHLRMIRPVEDLVLVRDAMPKRWEDFINILCPRRSCNLFGAAYVEKCGSTRLYLFSSSIVHLVLKLGLRSFIGVIMAFDLSIKF